MQLTVEIRHSIPTMLLSTNKLLRYIKTPATYVDDRIDIPVCFSYSYINRYTIKYTCTASLKLTSINLLTC